VNKTSSFWHNSYLSLTPWIASLGTALLLSATPAMATLPPLGTVIGNQASAQYLDNTGTQRFATSNMVQVTVSQVGAFTLSSNNVKSGAAGNVIYAPHVISNTGNGPDSFSVQVADAGIGASGFSRIEIYADPNNTGLPSGTTPLCSNASGTSAPACSAGFITTIAGNGGTFTFVVAYTVPSIATSGSWPHDTGTVTVAPSTTTSSWYSTYSPTTSTNSDLINLASGASFSVTKSISIPAVVAPGGGAWPTLIAGGQASAASCSTTWTAGMQSTTSPVCTYAVYTIKYTNSGAASGTLYMRDPIPSGLAYVVGSAIWSSNPGVALSETNVSNPTNMSFTEAANTITATISNVAPNVNGTLSFVALVKSGASAGSSSTNNILTYVADPSTCTGSTISTCSTNITNPSAFSVSPTYGVVAANTSSTSTDVADGGTAGNPPNSGIDKTLMPTVAAGGTVTFTNVITNTGNSTDSFNLTWSNPTGSLTFPTGTQFSFYHADGVTPLLDTNNDGIVDTGPIAAGASLTITVHASVPTSAGVGSGPYNILVQAISTSAIAAGSTAVPDGVWDQVSLVIGSMVDITNTASGVSCASAPTTCDLGPGPSTAPTTTTTTPAGTGITYNVFIKNNDTLANSYSFSASSSNAFPGNLPTGWTVKFVAAGGNCASPALTSVGPIASGAQSSVVACVTPPITAGVGSQNIYFQVNSTSAASTGGVISDTLLDAVNVTAQVIASDTLTPANNGQIGAGATTVYPHILTNTGNQSCGAFTITATLPAADVAAGWTTAIYIDNNKDGLIDANDTLVTTSIPALLPGASTALLIKVFAPLGASAGTTDTATITATDNVGACPVQTITDISTIVTSQLHLIKSQVADPTCSGNLASLGGLSSSTFSVKSATCIVYQIVGTNQGIAPIANIVIADAIPSFTNYEGATQPSTNCSTTGFTGTTAAFSTQGSPVNSVYCGSSSNSMAPGGAITLTFAVKVNQ